MYPVHGQFPSQQQLPPGSWPRNGPPRPPYPAYGPAPGQANPLKRSFSERHQPVYAAVLPPHAHHHPASHSVPNSLRHPSHRHPHIPSHQPGPHFFAPPQPAYHTQPLPRRPSVHYPPPGPGPGPIYAQTSPPVFRSAQRARSGPDEIDRQTEIFTDAGFPPPPRRYLTPNPTPSARMDNPHSPVAPIHGKNAYHSLPVSPAVGVMNSNPLPSPQSLRANLAPASLKFSSSEPVNPEATTPELSKPEPPTKQPLPLVNGTIAGSSEPLREPPTVSLRSSPPGDVGVAPSAHDEAIEEAEVDMEVEVEVEAEVEQDPVEPIALDLAAFRRYFQGQEAKNLENYLADASICMQRANHASQAKLIETYTKHVPLSKISPFASQKPLKSATVSRPDKIGTGQRVFGHVVQKHATIKGQDHLVAFPVQTFSVFAHKIPLYTHYVSSKRNALVESEKQRTFLPYLGENDDDLDTDYLTLEKKILENQEKGRTLNESDEFASAWLPRVDRILAEVGTTTSTVLRVLIDESRKEAPAALTGNDAALFEHRPDWITEGFYEEAEESDQSPRTSPKPQRKWRIALQNLPEADDRSVAAAILACFVFMEVCGFSLWHIVRQSPIAAKACREAEDHPTGRTAAANDSKGLYAYLDQACIVCHTHQCSGHGDFSDDEDGQDVRRAMTTGLDPRMILDEAKMAQRSRNVAKEVDMQLLLGKDVDNVVDGQPWTLLDDTAPGIADSEFCSKKCFWNLSNRVAGVANAIWSRSDSDLLETLGPAFATHRRGACALARMGVMQRSCVEIFYKLVNLTPTVDDARQTKQLEGQAHANKEWKYWSENTSTWQHELREPFRPCRHEGKCKRNPKCSCWRLNVSCEKSCNCPSICSRRFRGCRCHAGGKPCSLNDRCDCRQLNRECDPDLCGTCGAHEILDPVNRYEDGITKGRCTNVTIQRAFPKHTQIGQSKLMADGNVSGWGLFMGEEARKGDYIGEYTGEIVTQEESEQRGIIYNALKLSYLFDLNKSQVLDSTPIGNKLRYINHQGPDFANCQAKVMFCGGVQRIGMFAKSNIRVGEELLFDYGKAFADKIDMITMRKDGTVAIEKAKKGNEIPITNAHKKLPADLDKQKKPRRKKAPKAMDDFADPEDDVDDDDAMEVDEDYASSEEEGAEIHDPEDDVEEEMDEDESEDDEDDDEEADDEDDREATPRPKAPSLKKKKSKSGVTASDRMRKAWISRYRNLGRLAEAKKQEAKYNKNLGK